MAKLRMDAEEKTELLAYLEALIGCVTSLQTSVSRIMTDIEAMRSTIFDDPDELASHRHTLKSAVTSAQPRVEDTIRSYDGLLEEISASQQYKN
ncbi:MAG: hypothetical protein WBR26_20815 [Candidatus Acidiferrum sp.]